MTQTPSFERLVATISQVHTEMTLQASRAVNKCLTLRNWLIGAYIVEYEQQVIVHSMARCCLSV